MGWRSLKGDEEQGLVASQHGYVEGVRHAVATIGLDGEGAIAIAGTANVVPEVGKDIVKTVRHQFEVTALT